jgi:hypothetical protein
MKNRPTNKRGLNYVGLITLLFANGLSIWQFASGNGSILQVLWIYWLQSVIIGAINVVRILQVPINQQFFQVGTVSQSAKIDLSKFKSLIRLGAAAFFVFHYGFSHVIYAIFLVSFASNPTLESTISSNMLSPSFGTVSIGLVVLTGVVFWLHHASTFIVELLELKKYPEEAPNIQEVMRRPYSRIIPMHFIIILGPVISVALNNIAVFGVFIALKTLVDVRQFYKGIGHPNKITAFFHN